MSGRTVPRLALVGLLGMAFAAPAAAQGGGFFVALAATQLEYAVPLNGTNPAAPMPREKKETRVQVELRFATPVLNERNFDVFAVPVMNPTRCPACLAPAVRPRPARQGAPDMMKQMAADVFGDLLLQSGVTSPCPAPAPPYPLPQVRTVTVTAIAQRPGIVGTWYRDIGAKRCAIQVEHDHMTITVSESRELDGRAVTAHVTFTADYHLARDGSTAVGLITGVDMSFDGDVPEQESDSMMEAIGELRKAMEDRPFAMNCRLYGQTLVIGNVRMPELKDQREQPSSYIAGRYTSAATKPMPKRKAMKVTEPKVSLPDLTRRMSSPAERPEQLIGTPACPTAGAVIETPLPLPPSGYAARPDGNGNLLTSPGPSAASVVRPYADRTPPTPAPVEEVGSLLRGLKDVNKEQKKPSDPNARVEQLLRESEDLRQKNEWRRFWFNE